MCTGSEGSAVVPLEMLNAAYKASSPGLLIADVRYKGGMYVELTQTNQHVEYIYVDTIATENYEAFCGMTYDAPARSNPSTELVIKPGTCGAVPGQQKTRQCLWITRPVAAYAVADDVAAQRIVSDVHNTMRLAPELHISLSLMQGAVGGCLQLYHGKYSVALGGCICLC